MKKCLIFLLITLLLLGGVFLFIPEKKQKFSPNKNTQHNQSSQHSLKKKGKKKLGNFFTQYHTFSVPKNSKKKGIILWKDNKGNQLNSLFCDFKFSRFALQFCKIFPEKKLCKCSVFGRICVACIYPLSKSRKFGWKFWTHNCGCERINFFLYYSQK